MPRRVRIDEAVPGASTDALKADLLRRKEHRVVNRDDAARCQEVVNEPRADHAVVHDPVAAGGQPAGGGSCRGDDDGVLAVSFWKPRILVAPGDEIEEPVADNERARVEAGGEMSRDRRLP